MEIRESKQRNVGLLPRVQSPGVCGDGRFGISVSFLEYVSAC